MMAEMDDPRYVETWSRYRRLAWTFWLMLPLWPIYGSGMMAMGFDRQSPWIFWPFAIVWITIRLLANFTKCPRCGNHFFFKWWYGNGFTRSCLHCGLPKYATYDLDRKLAIAN